MPALTYLDNNATTPLSERALALMREAYASAFGNSSSPHALGLAARDVLEDSRARIWDALGRPGRLIFASGCTEANLLCLAGALRHPESPFRQLVVSDLEHSSVHGFLELELPVPAVSCRATREGLPDLEHLQALVSAKRSLVSMMHANNETGAVFPLAEIARIVHARGGLLHTDAAQSVGKLSLEEASASCDALTFSAHKFHGPLGAGGLAVMNAELKLAPVSPGGMQEGGVRSGTVNVPAIAGAAAALGECLEDPRPEDELASPRDGLESFLQREYPQCLIVSRETPRIWTTSCVCFPGLLQDDLIRELSERGVCVGKGAACAKGLGGSRVLKSMGIDGLLNQGGLRFSFSRRSTRSDLERLLEAFPAAYSAALEKGPYAPQGSGRRGGAA